MKLSGSISFRMFKPSQQITTDMIGLFAKSAMPPIDTLGDGTINGWVTSRHLLDRDITKESAMVAGFLCLSLAQAEKKIPEGLFRAECNMEEAAQLAASGNERLSAATRREIRQSVRSRLMPQAQPVLKGIQIVYDPISDVLYASCLSERQHDAMIAFMIHTTHINLIEISPATRAISESEVNTRDLDAVSFSPQCEDNAVIESVGMDFIMWLWFIAEFRGGMIHNINGFSIALMIEGPLQFTTEGNSARKIAIREGEPIFSPATQTCLMSGAKLSQAKVTFAIGDQVWTFTLGAGASGWIIRGLKLPNTEKLDKTSVFQERMSLLNQWRTIFLSIFDLFIRTRNNITTWDNEITEIHEWATNRKSRT